MIGGSQWQGGAGASAEALQALRDVAPVPLPQSFYDLLAFSDGGEGSLSVLPLTFFLNPAAEITRLERDGTLKHFFPGFFAFGSDGEGEIVAFDYRTGTAPYPIIGFDMANIDPGAPVSAIAADFDQFLALLV